MDLDLTLLLQLALLLVLVPVLERLLFKPMLRVIEARQQMIHGTRSEVDRLERLSHADRTAYEDRMRGARRQAQAEREALRSAGRAEARKVLDQGRQAQAAVMARARAEVAASERAAAADLDGQAVGLCSLLLTNLLGREVAR